MNIPVTLVYNAPEQKVVYEAIQAALGPKVQLSGENIPTFEGSATELRNYYSPGNEDNSQVHPNIHPVVDKIIREQCLYGYEDPHKLVNKRTLML